MAARFCIMAEIMEYPDNKIWTFNETFNTHLHTVDTLVLLVKDTLDNHYLNYVMLGKFQCTQPKTNVDWHY